MLIGRHLCRLPKENQVALIKRIPTSILVEMVYIAIASLLLLVFSLDAPIIFEFTVIRVSHMRVSHFIYQPKIT
jgi:hypothetical protein